MTMSDDRTLENCPAGPSGHDWTIVDVDIRELEVGSTAVVEVCERCRAIRQDRSVKVVGGREP